MKKHQFLDLIENNQGIIHKICRLYANQEEYKDLYQDILMNLWNSIDRFEEKSKPSTWIYRVALYTALNHRRYQSYRKFTPLDQGMESTDNIAHQADEAGELVMTALRALTEEERALMILYLEGYSYKEIADTLGISTSNTGVRINRIKVKLKDIINKI